MKLIRSIANGDTRDDHYYASGHFRVRITVYEDGRGLECRVDITNVQTLGGWTELGYMVPSDVKGRKTKKAYVQRALELAIQFIDGE